MKIKILAVAMAAALIAGCGTTIKEKSTASVAENTPLEAGVGDALLKIQTVKNLPNAFWKADIFGRTTPTGLTTVTYQGMRDGKAVLVRDTLDIETGATTMNSTPVVIPNQSSSTYHGNVGGTYFSGTATTTGSPTVIPANTPQAITHQRGAIALEVSKTELPANLPVGEFVITVTDFSGLKLDYSVRRKMKSQ
jgi:hypothetical protein